MKHLDLFSGIGGFALAVDEVWPGVEHIFCEIDPFCQAVLKKHWKGSEICGDIRGLTADTQSTRQLRAEQYENNNQGEQGGGAVDIDKENKKSRPFILTGGFPCQPFSQAGKRRGTSDNRFLWPEMLRVIHEFRPSWVIAENVRGLLTIEQGMVFEQVCLDLEGENYEVQPFIIPAVAVNAPHRRDRVWFVANSTDARTKGVRPKGADEAIHAPDTINQRLQGGERPGTLQAGGEVAHGSVAECGGNPSWNKNWLEVATELCGVDDGLSARVDGLELSKSKHRVERLKALGNAIVPQVAIEIMRAIQYSEVFSD